jgi:hypothetical protein
VYDLEREQLRKTYQLCGMGFGINAFALVLACFTSTVSLFSFIQPDLVRWINSLFWFKWLEAPIVWGSLIGTTLLWGRWDHVSWQRRTGLLLLMCLVDVASWFVKHGPPIGLNAGDVGHEWLRDNLGEALGWGEFALLSSLSCDYLVHLGVDHARDSDKSTRSMAVTGALVWLLFFCQQTNWGAGWPLQHRRFGGLEAMLLWQGVLLIWTITLIQVTALVISATRQSSHVIAEIDHEDQENDLLRSRSDSRAASDLVPAYRDDDNRPG